MADLADKWSKMIRVARCVLVEEIRNEMKEKAKIKLKFIRLEEIELAKMYGEIPPLLQLTIDWERKNVENKYYLP